MALINVFNLATAHYSYYAGITEEEAVMAAYAQSKGDFNTWNYREKYGHMVRHGKRSVSCEDFTAIKP